MDLGRVFIKFLIFIGILGMCVQCEICSWSDEEHFACDEGQYCCGERTCCNERHRRSSDDVGPIIGYVFAGIGGFMTLMYVCLVICNKCSEKAVSPSTTQ